MSLISTLKRLPSLSKMPDNVLLAGVAAAVVFVFVFFFLVIASLVSGEERSEHEEHKASDPHKLIADLHKNLISEMKGTSKQNTLMINLTVLFILVTIIGIIASILGPERSAAALKHIGSSIGSLFSHGFGSVRKVTGK
jgi:NADH:ubiquinone oxidoreductase subunit 5 (subunit L)/multisubunit Na+/H+ antiporter MnhA subunit